MTAKRPYILVDVDGVLNPMLRCNPPYCKCHPAWIRRKLDIHGARLKVYLNREHGRQLLGLAERTGAELAWGTTWEELANEHIGPVIGLPQLPVAPMWRKFSGSSKPLGMIPWTAGRPFVWFDDEPDLPAAARELATQPHLVVTTDERVGLTEKHVETAGNWLTALAGEFR